jgi:hypothetical protein
MLEFADIQKLLDFAAELEDFGKLWSLSTSSKLLISNAAYLLQLAAKREKDGRENAQ